MDYPELKATPIKRDWAMKVANALRTGRDVANKVEIPVLGGLGDMFIGKSPEGFERVAYDEPLTKGAGWTTKPTDELVDMAFLGLDVAPIARAATRGAVKGADRLTNAVRKNREIIEPAIEAVK
jgi:hypothetical protein